MAIDLSQSQTDSLISQGAITSSTPASGDLGGTYPSPVVTALQGQLVPSGGYADGFGLVHDGDEFQLLTVLTENTNFTGDLSGSQAAGIRVAKIDNVAVEIGSPNSGDVISYNGTAFTNTPLVAGFNTVTLSASAPAEDKQIILADSRTTAFTITCPASPSNGDAFYVLDSHGQFATNAVSVIGEGSDQIEGETTAIVLNIDKTAVLFAYNGTEWRFFVI